MQSVQLSSYSTCGKFFPRSSIQNISTVELKQHTSHQKPFQACKFDLAGNKIYLLDASGVLICMSLTDNSFSSLKGYQTLNFEIDVMNNFSLLMISKKSELMKVSFESKQVTKIMNLNMNKIIAFQRNYIRELLLILDYKILFLCDPSNRKQIRSVKADYQETFSNACFGNQNRFIVLAVKNIEIRILQILDFTVLQSITLPFEIKNLKIEVSLDFRTIAVYGDCNIIFLITISENIELTYELLQISHLRSVKQLKFTYQSDIIILANDQIIYGISPQSLHRLSPLFNNQQKLRLMAFDVACDCKKIVVVSNRTVFTLLWKQGIKKAIETASNTKRIDISKQDMQNHHKYQIPPQNLQYQEQESQDQNQQKSIKKNDLLLTPSKNLKNQFHLKFETSINSSNLNKQDKNNFVHQIYDYLLKNIEVSAIIIGFKNNCIDFISKILTIINNPKKTAHIAYSLLSRLSEYIDDIDKYSLSLIPLVVQRVIKSRRIKFQQFLIENVLNVFQKYIPFRQKIEVLNLIIQNIDKNGYIIVLAAQIFKYFWKKREEWPIVSNIQTINLQEIVEEVNEIYRLAKHKRIFDKGSHRIAEQSMQQSQENIQDLVTQKQRLKEALDHCQK